MAALTLNKIATKHGESLKGVRTKPPSPSEALSDAFCDIAEASKHIKTKNKDALAPKLADAILAILYAAEVCEIDINGAVSLKMQMNALNKHLDRMG